MSLARSALGFVVLCAPAFAATTWHVSASAACPGLGTVGAPFCTIQDALDAAVSGDEILVAPGSFTETIDFLGKDVVLRSSAGPATTIINGTGGGPVVTFANGEGRGARLEGFSVRHGFDFTSSGGGVSCVGSSPTIVDNIIEINASERGGGLALFGGSPLVTGNTVRDNAADNGCGIFCGAGTTAQIVGNSILSNGTGTVGGGIDVRDGAAPMIEGNLIEGNTCSGGAGINVESTGVVLIRGNEIRDNQTDEGDGGGLFTSASTLVEGNAIVDNFAFGDGGGVWADGGTFRNNLISENLSLAGYAVVASPGTSFDGDRIVDNAGQVGALSIDYGLTHAGVTLRRVTIANEGLAAAWIESDTVFEDCLIAGGEQGLVITYPTTTVTLRRCTISDHELYGVLTQFGAHADVESCVVWGNGPFAGMELFPDTGTIDASWSIVRDGYPGTGNLDADPLFTDAPGGDYALLPGSPAIDSGNPADGVCAFDLAGSPRRLDGQLDVGSEIDRGALEFDNGHLETSVPNPGTLQIDLTGTAGLQAWLFGGLTPSQLCVEKWGRFGLNLSGPYIVVPWLSAPSSLQANIAPAFSGLPIVLQALVGNAGNFGQTGNLTNAVALELP